MNPQAGYGLLFLLLIGSVAYAIFFPLINTARDLRHEQFSQLRYAKKLLLAYARSFPLTLSTTGNSRAGTPPMLPCPALEKSQTEGTQHSSCGQAHVASIGLFPWKSLGAQPLFSSLGECLWYVVAGNVKQKNVTVVNTQFNTDSDQWIHYQNQYGVAAVLAPRESRSRSEKTSHFLCRNSFNPEDVFSLSSSASFDVEHADVVIDLSNQDSFDVMLLTREELLSSYTQSERYQQLIHRLGETLAKCFASVSSFSTTNLTWHTPFATDMQLSDDRLRNAYREKENLYAGRLPYSFNSTNMRDECAQLFVNLPKEEISHSVFNKSTLNQAWVHSKNLWFMRTFPQCQPDSGANCMLSAAQKSFAVIFYAGQQGENQSRLSPQMNATAREDINNYLEGNALAIFQQNTTIRAPSIKQGEERASQDFLYCIDTTKQVRPC